MKEFADSQLEELTGGFMYILESMSNYGLLTEGNFNSCRIAGS